MNAIGERGIWRHLSPLFERTANISPWYGPEQPTTSLLVLEARPVGRSVSLQDHEFCRAVVFLLLAFWDKGGENTLVPFFLQRGMPSPNLNFVKLLQEATVNKLYGTL
jgi:hypothetical protein